MTDQDRDAPSPADAREAAKARFREALERKRATGHRSAQGAGNPGAVRGSETTGSTPRSFRRRSGSA